MVMLLNLYHPLLAFEEILFFRAAELLRHRMGGAYWMPPAVHN